MSGREGESAGRLLYRQSDNRAPGFAELYYNLTHILFFSFPPRSWNLMILTWKRRELNETVLCAEKTFRHAQPCIDYVFQKAPFFAAVKYSSWWEGRGNRTPLPAGCCIDYSSTLAVCAANSESVAKKKKKSTRKTFVFLQIKGPPCVNQAMRLWHLLPVFTVIAYMNYMLVCFSLAL